MDNAEISNILAETVHTAFRKGCDGGKYVHNAITQLPPEQWSKAIEWMIWALDVSGYAIVRKPTTERV